MASQQSFPVRGRRRGRRFGVTRKELHNALVGKHLRLPPDPSSIAINPRFPLVLTFSGDSKGTTFTIENVLDAVQKRFSFDMKTNSLLEVAIISVRAWCLKPASNIRLTVHPVVGWDGTRQFSDTGNSYTGARVGFEWPRDEWNQLSGAQGKSNHVCSIGSTHDFIVHLNIIWIRPWTGQQDYSFGCPHLHHPSDKCISDLCTSFDRLSISPSN